MLPSLAVTATLVVAVTCSATGMLAFTLTVEPVDKDEVGQEEVADTQSENDGGGGLIVKVRVAVPVPPLLVALSVTVDVPAVVGVPEIKPVPVLTRRLAGNPVALKLVGLLLAVI